MSARQIVFAPRVNSVSGWPSDLKLDNRPAFAPFSHLRDRGYAGHALSRTSSYHGGVALPHNPDPKPRGGPDLVALAAQASKDPSARAFVDEVKAAVADGSIWDQLAEQEDIRTIVERHAR